MGKRKADATPAETTQTDLEFVDHGTTARVKINTVAVPCQNPGCKYPAKYRINYGHGMLICPTHIGARMNFVMETRASVKVDRL